MAPGSGGRRPPDLPHVETRGTRRMSEAERERRVLDTFVAVVIGVGMLAIGAVGSTAVLTRSLHVTTTMLVLGLALVLGELRPVKVARGEEGDDEITISSTFAMALVMTAPLAVAVGAQICAVLVDDLRRRKPARRVAFNVAQYSLTLIGARLAYAGLTHRAILGDVTPMHPSD